MFGRRRGRGLQGSPVAVVGHRIPHPPSAQLERVIDLILSRDGKLTPRRAFYSSQGEDLLRTPSDEGAAPDVDTKVTHNWPVLCSDVSADWRVGGHPESLRTIFVGPRAARSAAHERRRRRDALKSLFLRPSQTQMTAIYRLNLT